MPNRAEIDQREAAVGTADHVGGLDVTVNDRWCELVQVVERVGGIVEKPPNLRRTEHLATAAERRQRLALDTLHHQTQRAVELEMIDVLGQARMIERLLHQCFTFRQLDVFPRGRTAHEEALHGHAPPGRLVLGFQRLALSAGAQATDDRVATLQQLTAFGLIAARHRSASIARRRADRLAAVGLQAGEDFVDAERLVSSVHDGAPSFGHGELRFGGCRRTDREHERERDRSVRDLRRRQFCHQLFDLGLLVD